MEPPTAQPQPDEEAPADPEADPAPARSSARAPLLSWLVPGVVLALVSAGLTALLSRQYRAGRIDWKSWEHEAGSSWHWVPFVHPPAFTEYMRAFERWSAESGLPEGQLLALAAIALLPPVTLLCAWLASDGPSRKHWIVLAALLMALSPTSLRPFEQYPLSRLLLAASLVALLLWSVRGGLMGWVLALLAAFAAVEFHLSSWFLLGPLLLGLIVALPERRRALGVMTVALLCAFTWTTQPGVFGNSLADVLDQPGVRNRGIFVPPDWDNPTFEYSNPILYMPLFLWLLPAVRRSEPRGLALALSLGVYVLAHIGLQQQGLAINSNAPEPHHYFEMIEIAAICGSVWALAAAWQAWQGRVGRVLVGAVVLAVLVSQLHMTARVYGILRDAAR